MRLLFFIPRMSVGGAERVLSEIANRLAEDGFDTTIATMGDGEDFYPLDRRIRRIRLGLSGRSRHPVEAVFGNVRSYLTIRRTIVESRPAVVISFLDRTNVRVLLATMGLRVPVIVTEHSHPGTHPIGRPWSVLRRLLYPRARYLVAVGRGVYDWFSWLPEARRALIYNPVPRVRPAADALDVRPVRGRKRLVSAGRFVASKGFDRLIRAFGALSDDHPDWDLLLYGEGPLAKDLAPLAASLSLSDRVRLPGVVADLHTALARCDLFCLTSTTEGLGMVILEAMQAGLPVVSTDCPTGPRELIRDRHNGRLVPVGDHDALVRVLGELMGDREERVRLARGAREVLARHSLDLVIESWKRLLDSC